MSELDDQFIEQNLMAAAKASFDRLGIDKTDEIYSHAYRLHIDQILERERERER